MSESAWASAPGRVNLIGEHTDYHDGFVLPMVIPQRTHVHLERRRGKKIRAFSKQLERDEEYESGREKNGRGWLDYVQGVTWALRRHGVRVPGLDIRIESTVPIGAGVSSSAALEISLLRALRELLELDLDDVTLAKLAHAVETDFVGAPVGIMDQVASSLGRQGEALFLDTRALDIERLPLPAGVEVVAIHSGVTHAHAAGDYQVRRRESFEAAALLGVNTLRDVDLSMLDRVAALPPPLCCRARHIVTENARVLDAVEAIREGEPERLGALFTDSHASMRDDYQITVPAIDALVAIAAEHPEVHGARMTGGGFGGAVVMVAHGGAGTSVAREVSAEYAAATGNSPSVILPSIH